VGNGGFAVAHVVVVQDRQLPAACPNIESRVGKVAKTRLCPLYGALTAGLEVHAKEGAGRLASGGQRKAVRRSVA